MDYRGYEVKDKITGYTGIVICHCKYLYNVDRVGVITTNLENGVPKESEYFDITQIKVIGVIPAIKPEILIEHSFNLGDAIIDTLSEYEGVITGFSHWLNGCVRTICQSKKLDKNGNPVEEAFLNIKQIKLKNAEVVMEAKKKVGGPMPSPKQIRNPK